MPPGSRQRCRPELVGPQPAIAMQPRRGSWGCHFVDQGRQRLSGGTDTWPRLLTGPKTPGLARGSTGRCRPTSKGWSAGSRTWPGAAVVSGVAGAQRDRVGQQVQDGQQLGDLLVGVGGGELQAEADLLPGHTRVERQGGVDAVVQQEAAGPWQIVGVLKRHLEDREAGGGRVVAPSLSRWSRTRRVLAYRMARSSSPRMSLICRPTSALASDAIGDGPEYRYGGAVTLSSCLSAVGQAMKASSEE